MTAARVAGRATGGRNHGVRRALARELVVVCAGAVLLAVAMTWPTLRHPASRIPGDLRDPMVEAWILSWGGHTVGAHPLGALVHPTGALTTNAFYPLRMSYAFDDMLLGYAPAASFGGGNSGALVCYNVLFVLAHAASFVGMYALARQLGARLTGAVVAGAAFAYAPYQVAHDVHLNIVSVGGIPLALAMLARGHGFRLAGPAAGFRADAVRPGWAVAGWLVAAWQVSLGFAIGLGFLYAMLLVGLAAVLGWSVLGRPAVPRRLVLADLGGGLLFVAATVALALPYLWVIRAFPYANRGLRQISVFSPPWWSYLVAPEHSLLWGPAAAAARRQLINVGEMTLLPGVVVLLLGLLGVAVSTLRRRWRLVLAAVGLAAGWLSLGVRAPGGVWLWAQIQQWLPGWQSTRTPGRLGLYVLFVLALLAAFAVTRLQEALPGRRALVLGLLPVLVLVEGLSSTPHPRVPPEPAAMAAATGPLLVLPANSYQDPLVMFWSTNGFPKMINGVSSFNPGYVFNVRKRLESFPDADTVAYLRRAGVRSVVLLPGLVAGTPWQGAADKPYADLGVTRRRIGDGYLYTIPGR